MNRKTMTCLAPVPAAVLLAIFMAGCNVPPQATVDETPVEQVPPMAIGGSRDAHDCLVSAGYSWCERTAKCERSWELAQQRGFDNSADGYTAWCSAKDVDGKVVPSSPDEGSSG